MGARVYISYRHADAGLALALRERLTAALGREPVFAVDAGRSSNYLRLIEQAIRQCDVVLALIGRDWVAARDDHGAWGLEDPQDPVRFEIEAALDLKKTVIPILVDDAEMPRPDQLPHALVPLSLLQALRVSTQTFDRDAFRLLDELERMSVRPTSAASASFAPAPPRPLNSPLTSGQMLQLLAVGERDPDGPQPVRADDFSASEDAAQFDRHVARFPSADRREDAMRELQRRPVEEPYRQAAPRAPVPPPQASMPPPQASRPPYPSSSSAHYERQPAKSSGSGARRIGLLLSCLTGVALAYALYREQLNSIVGSLIAGLGIKLNAFSFAAVLPRRGEEVECSVFSPRSAPADSSVLVQVFLHAKGQHERAEGIATILDPSTSTRGVQPLRVKIKRGAAVTISLSSLGLEIDEPQVTVHWNGDPTFGQFEVRLPPHCSGRSFVITARISVDGGLVGCIKFSLAANESAHLPIAMPSGRGRPYDYAFLSYATPDRKEVLKRAQVLRAAGVNFFQDILTLDPGDRWQKKIFEHIDTCDLFLLFWSRAAMDSPAVIQEAERALARQNAGADIDIVPVILETPPPLPPPPSLGAIHFNDKINHLIAVS